jgi:hypothetical protein
MIKKRILACHRLGTRWVTRTMWVARAMTVSAALLMLALPALAGLGENVSSVQADQAHMQGTLRSTQSESYTLHEITTASGVVVREYVSAATGKVFAVAWQGAWPPDMRQVLASYFAQYQQSAQTPANSHVGRRPLVIHQPGLVVESGGHLRSFVGRAYIPDMVPDGVKTEVIR